MIDVIIPAYNAHNTLERALLSINIQTIKDKVNIYVIDDNSWESYDKIINNFKSRLNINLIVLDENKGPGNARNIGLEESNNPYILFLDSDDELHNAFSLEHLLNNIEYYDMCYGGIFHEENLHEYTYYDIHNGCLHGKLYKREIIDKYNIKFPIHKYSEDNYFNQLYIILADNICSINEPVYIYNNVSSSLTKDNEENVSYYYNYSMNLLLNKCEELNIEKYKIKDIIITTLCYNYQEYISSDCEKKFYISQVKDNIIPFYRKYSDLISEYDFKLKLCNYNANALEKISFKEYLELLLK